MVNYVITAVLAVVVLLAARSALKHFRGEGGCCGGNGAPRKRKVLPAVTGRIELAIEGMHCAGCAARVEKALNELDGVSAEVSLSGRLARVDLSHSVSAAELCAAVERAGYRAAVRAQEQGVF